MSTGYSYVHLMLWPETQLISFSGSGDGSSSGFKWIDGVFLQALKSGAWVLLDELNLASQSVLEGLNAVLDHRATVYIPGTVPYRNA